MVEKVVVVKIRRARRRISRETFPSKLEREFHTRESWVQWNFRSEIADGYVTSALPAAVADGRETEFGLNHLYPL